MAPKFVSLKQALRDLKLTESELKQLMAGGEIRSLSIDGETKIYGDDVARLKQETGKTMLLGGDQPRALDPEGETENEIPNLNQREFLSFHEARMKLRLDANAMLQFVKNGEIEAIGSGEEMKFRRQEVEQLELGTGKTILRADQTSATMHKDPVKPQPEYVSFDQARKRLRLTADELEHLVAGGQLASHGQGMSLQFLGADVETLASDTGSTVFLGGNQNQDQGIGAPSDHDPIDAGATLVRRPGQPRMTFAEAAQALQLHPDELKQLVSSGELPVRKEPEGWLFDRGVVENLVRDTGATIQFRSKSKDQDYLEPDIEEEIEAFEFDELTPPKKKPKPVDDIIDDSELVGSLRDSEKMAIQHQPSSRSKTGIIIVLLVIAIGAGIALWQGWI